MPSGHLHLFSQLNGVDGNFVLDTGAGTTVIEKKNKEKFGMQTKATENKATGAGGTGMLVVLRSCCLRANGIGFKFWAHRACCLQLQKSLPRQWLPALEKPNNTL